MKELGKFLNCILLLSKHKNCPFLKHSKTVVILHDVSGGPKNGFGDGEGFFVGMKLKLRQEASHK